MSRFPKKALWIAGAAVLAAVLILGRTAYRHYAEVRSDFEPAPRAPLSDHPEQTGIAGLREISFRSREGLRVAAWYAPSRNRAAVVVAHGTNADRSSMLGVIRILASGGFGVLAFDWPGDGASEGEIHWNHTERQALVSAVDWLVERPEIDQNKIGALAFSMGGYVLTGVAAREPRLQAVVLEATPTDYLTLQLWQNKDWGLLSELPARLALRESGMPLSELRPIDVVRQIAPRPLLIIQGDEDGTVPAWMAQELFQAAGAGKSLWMVAGAHHGDYEVHAGGEYQARLLHFFNDSLKTGRQ